jgi:hypothetical protein
MKIALLIYGGAFMPDFDNSLQALIAVSFIIYTVIVFALTFQVTGANKKIKALESKLSNLATASQVKEVVTKLDKGFVDALLLFENNILHTVDDIIVNVKMLPNNCQPNVDTASVMAPEHTEDDKISAAIEYARAGYENDQIVKILQLNADVVEEITKFNRPH